VAADDTLSFCVCIERVPDPNPAEYVVGFLKGLIGRPPMVRIDTSFALGYAHGQKVKDQNAMMPDWIKLKT
jgi:hypothetical protein